MNCVKDKDIPLEYQLASEMLGLSSERELDYYEVEHIIALSLAVNEVYARAGAGATKYWESICNFYRDDDIYGGIYTQVCENSIDDEAFDICDYLDIENIALFTMEYVKDKLNIDEGYFNIDLTGQVANIVNDCQYFQQEKLANEISNATLCILSEGKTLWNWEKLLSYGYHYNNVEFFTDIEYLFKEEIYSEEETPFLSALVLSFPENKGQFTVNREIYTALSIHFMVFKEAYVFSLLDEIIDSEDLYSLVFDFMRAKLFRASFYEGSKARQDYFYMVLNIINNVMEDSNFKNEDYEDYLIRAFFISAIKGNPLVLSASDFTPQHVILYSKLLKDILQQYKQRLIEIYEQIMNTD